MPKPKIRPPRAPKNESPKVTIANQAREIKNLTQRCVDLVTSRDQETRHALEYRRQCDDAQQIALSAGSEIETLRCELDGMKADVNRLIGYQERVREEDKHRYGDLGVAS